MDNTRSVTRSLTIQKQQWQNAGKDLTTQKRWKHLCNDEMEPIGIVRDWDLITRVVAFKSNPDLVRVDEIMYTPEPNDHKRC